MNASALISAVMENLQEYSEAYAKVYRTMLEAGLPEPVAREEAQNKATMVVALNVLGELPQGPLSWTGPAQA